MMKPWFMRAKWLRLRPKPWRCAKIERLEIAMQQIVSAKLVKDGAVPRPHESTANVERLYGNGGFETRRVKK